MIIHITSSIIRRTSFLLLYLLLATDAWTQTGEDALAIDISRMTFASKSVVPPSPEAAELGKYGNVPVSLFTGTPQISIPFFDIRGSALDLPISLSYHASGFRPETIATWVGLGWSLNAGGVITRSVLGNPDNTNNYFYQTTSPLDAPPYSSVFGYYDYTVKVKGAVKETRPDIYYFNFGNFSGKFYIKPDGSIFKKEKDNLKIEHCIDCTNSYFFITDDHGTKYFFSQVETTRMVADDEAGNIPAISYTYPSAWYLSAITSADGNEVIGFEYYSSTAEENIYSNMLQNTSVTYTKLGYRIYTDPPRVTLHTTTPPSVFIKRKFLKKISFTKAGQQTLFIDFVSATGVRQDANFSEDRVLQQLKVYSNINETPRLVKRYDFTYGYFVNTANVFTPRRLRLDALQEMTADGSSLGKPAYIFTYNSRLIPDRSTAGLDHWGFYNTASNSSLVPTITIDGNSYGYNANREPSLQGSSCTLLEKIQYPTGGYTSFSYELNQGAGNEAVGGVRIKEIIDYSAENKKAVSKKYEYTLEDGSSSGRSNRSQIKYDQHSSFHHYNEPVMGSPQPEDGDYTNTITTVSASSVFGLGSILGSHIGYTRVLEYLSDVTTNKPLGKTEYKYNFTGFKEFDEDVQNGDLLQKSIYDSDGKLLNEITNTYSYTVVDNLSTLWVKTASSQDNRYFLCKKIIDGMEMMYARQAHESMADCLETRTCYTRLNLFSYGIRSYARQLIQQQEKQYDQLSGAYRLRTTQYTYGSLVHTYPTLMEQSGSSGDLVVTANKYAGDYVHTTGSPDETTQGILLLQTKHVTNALVETRQYRKDADGTNLRYIGGSVIEYSRFGPYPQTVFSLTLSEPLLTMTESDISNGTFIKDDHYTKSGSFKYNTTTGNLVEQSKENDVVSSYLWDYYDTYPIVSVVNATSKEIAYTSFETASSGNWQLEEVSISSSLAITGKRAGLLSNAGSRIYRLFTQSPGKPFTVSYWSRNGELIVKINGSISVAGHAGSTRNGWTYYEHKLPAEMYQVELTGSVGHTIDELQLFPRDVVMTTYTYDHLTGVTTENNANQDMRYYSYDGFNRLINIKDNTGNIIKAYTYNYGSGADFAAPAATLWYNAVSQGSFIKENCPSGTEPETLIYTVPYGRYVSSLSQADADAKATADIAANGQNHVNANGQCLYWNVKKSMIFVRNNCLPEQGIGKIYNYVVAAHTYSSPVSQAVADALAQADIDANGQNEANTHGSCSCDADDKKVVNGNCETGVRINTGRIQQPNGQWRCSYVYQFSDASTKGPFYSYSSSPCPISN